MVRLGRFFFKYRDAVFPVVLIPMLIVFPVGGEPRIQGVVTVAGVVVALLGQALRAIVIGYVYILRGGRNRQVYAEDLVTTGFFAHARNPLYLGNMMILAGLFLIHGNPWVIALGSAFFLLVYVTIVAAEEEYLSNQFGQQYADYARRVPRWIPRLAGLSQTVSGMRFNWRRVIAKEYSSAAVWMAGAVLLVARHSGSAPEAMWIALLVLALAWVVARVLKKSGRLKQAHS